MGTAKIILSTDVLKRALHMPDETIILSGDYPINTITLTVFHPDITEVPVNDAVPVIRPTVTRIPEKFEWTW